MKRVSWKYLAGLIDGEGCIDLHVSKSRVAERSYMYATPRLRICLTDSSAFLLEDLRANFGGGLSKRDKLSLNPNWQNATSWELVGYKQACPVLRNVVNHLILKREQARLCLWMETHVKGKQLDQKVVDLIREELTLAKRDPHRLSETAQTRVWDAIVGASAI
jgi:hypothetical protein